ncbi:hypothetical protein L249_3605 [Ophiocordyceps polyrhachis-furcata BCC 54312]|uniref:Uncharacterized protein n=1 Tax=Ophiocordyceps polyrhachis-furcata BCC 54312 TaxID=1330021 RepID=A0A367LMF9_9HYPO|nr:hypothetical protein L249_3605 [Ophiocordyceps polyrhachis-furcata BCC 54312]
MQDKQMFQSPNRSITRQSKKPFSRGNRAPAPSLRGRRYPAVNRLIGHPRPEPPPPIVLTDMLVMMLFMNVFEKNVPMIRETRVPPRPVSLLVPARLAT